LLRESTSTMAKKLEAYGFIRIHRSVLVNTSFVEELHPWTAGEYVLRIKGGRELTVSCTYKKSLQSIAQFWVGTNGLLAA
jgi:two-component system, LytTR family, response regulator